MTKATIISTPSDPELKPSAPAIPHIAIIDRLKEMAGEAMDHLILGDGPPQPDYELLDVCGDLLHLMKRRKALIEQDRALFADVSRFGRLTVADRDRLDSESKRLTTEGQTLDGPVASLLSRARKLPATTAAGVYAKVLVVRASETGAGRLAQTLADDLIAIPNLRASIWPNEGGAAHD